jgi:hypothetical protein
MDDMITVHIPTKEWQKLTDAVWDKKSELITVIRPDGMQVTMSRDARKKEIETAQFEMQQHFAEMKKINDSLQAEREIKIKEIERKFAEQYIKEREIPLSLRNCLNCARQDNLRGNLPAVCVNCIHTRNFRPYWLEIKDDEKTIPRAPYEYGD